jgi:hypothetical protein
MCHFIICLPCSCRKLENCIMHYSNNQNVLANIGMRIPPPNTIMPDRWRVEYLHTHECRPTGFDRPIRTSIMPIPRNPLMPDIIPWSVCDYCLMEPSTVCLSIALPEIRSCLETHACRLTRIGANCQLSKLNKNPKHVMFVVLCLILDKDLSGIVMEYLRSYPAGCSLFDAV